MIRYIDYKSFWINNDDMQLDHIKIDAINAIPIDLLPIQQDITASANDPNPFAFGSTKQQETTKTGTIPVRLTIPGAPFVMPGRTFALTQNGNTVTSTTLLTDMWPIIGIQITDNIGGGHTIVFSMSPVGNTTQGKILYSRCGYFLGKAKGIHVEFPTVHKKFDWPVPFDEESLKRWERSGIIARKIQYIEKFFGKSFTLPSKFENDDLIKVEILFRGITKGEFVIYTPEMTSNWNPSIEALEYPPFTGVGRFSSAFAGDKMELFGQQLRVGRIVTIQEQTKLTNPEVVEQIRKYPNRPIDLHLTLLDQKMTWRFEKFIKELSRDEKALSKRLEEYKEKLVTKYHEPYELVDLVHKSLIENDPTDDSKVLNTIDTLLKQIEEEKINIPNRREVKNYLYQFPNLVELLPTLCYKLRQKLGKDMNFFLEVYKSKEEPDDFLTLYIQPVKYYKGLMDEIDEVYSEYEIPIAEHPGYLLVNVDYAHPRTDYGI